MISLTMVVVTNDKGMKIFAEISPKNVAARKPGRALSGFATPYVISANRSTADDKAVLSV